MLRLAALATAVAALAVTPVALGHGNGTTLKISADAKGAMKYDKKTLRAKPGKVTIVMTNPSFMPHDVAIKGKGIKTVKGKIVLKGGVSRVTAVLKKGTYRFFCSVPGHEAAGMWGTLIVR
jgi:plastocyanin